MNSCSVCQHFVADPQRIEAMIPGLNVLTSAFASVRAGDGICLRHDTYQSSHYICGDFAPPIGDPATPEPEACRNSAR